MLEVVDWKKWGKNVLLVYYKMGVCESVTHFGERGEMKTRQSGRVFSWFLKR